MNRINGLAKNCIPAKAAWLFPEYDFDRIELESHRGVIIERILERGSWAQVRWLFTTYAEDRVSAWVQRHGYRLLSKRSFAFWRLILGIDDYHAPPWAVTAKAMDSW